jgi:hypothetical protein
MRRQRRGGEDRGENRGEDRGEETEERGQRRGQRRDTGGVTHIGRSDQSIRECQ